MASITIGFNVMYLRYVQHTQFQYFFIRKRLSMCNTTAIQKVRCTKITKTEELKYILHENNG